MHGNKRTATGVVTESAVQAALRRGSQPALDPDEERLIRMRVGAGLSPSARLDRIASATDTEIELLAYEIEAFLVLKERRSAASPSRRSPSPSVRPLAQDARSSVSRTKQKIIRALRKKS